MTIYVGSVNRIEYGSEYLIKNIIKHPGYEKRSKQDDIALVEVTKML